MDLLDGRIAIVTGAANGIGLAVVRRFLEYGAHVVLGDRDARALEAALAELPKHPGAVAQRCDVTQADDVEALVARCVEVFGGLDVLVNNAGIARPARIARMAESDFDAVSMSVCGVPGRASVRRLRRWPRAAAERSSRSPRWAGSSVCRVRRTTVPPRPASSG